MRRPLLALALTLMSAGAGIAATPFDGTWTITRADKAPWEDPDNPIINDGYEAYIGKAITIGDGSMKGPDMLGCGKTEMAVATLPFGGLFEGGLGTDPKDPAGPYDEAKAHRLALELGFTSEPVPTLSHGCSEILLHLRDKDTILFGLDNRIYMMKRQ